MKIFFFEIVPLASSTLIPASFPLVEEPLKLLFWYDLRVRGHISFNDLHL